MTDSRALLAEYAENGTESAFRELVKRYIDLVYSTAQRGVGGDTLLAQDVTQNVFLQLARKGSHLSRDVVLGGWLHRAACRMAATAIRGERRRNLREKEAARMQALDHDCSKIIDQIAPFVDEAIDQLGRKDQTAIILRFFEQRDFHSVGQALGITEDAARMRVKRALEKLETMLKRRGITLSVSALSATLAGEAVCAAPVGLAGQVAATALAGAAVTGSLSLTILNTMAITKTKLAVASVVLAGVISTPLMLQHRSLRHQLEENTALRQQLQQFGELAHAHSNLVAQAETWESSAAAEKQELLRLRGEVGLLRRQLSEAEKLKAENARLRAVADNIRTAEPTVESTPWSPATPKDSWRFAGYATPEAALETTVSAWTKGEWDLFTSSLNPEGRKNFEKDCKGKPAAEAMAQFPIDLNKAITYRYKKKDVSENEVEFMLGIEFPINIGYSRTFTMKRIGSEWKADF